ncbi:MAG TPA: ACP S-malonyltransferase [Alphaproteobacteria bacterium]|nr:ACP S-malonyltransferase [Alphaproteobacteria bacterium]
MQNTAFLFPGQGSQTPGMAAAFAQHPTTKALFQQADDVLGFKLSALMADGPAEELTKTENAQPALLVAGYAAAAYVGSLKKDLAPKSIATGHSLGLYTAALAAGSYDFEFGLKLVRARGLAMSKAASGGMLAVLGLEIEQAEAVAADAEVSVANDNSPGQQILSGPGKNLEKAAELAKKAGAKKTIVLPVSGPFHTRAMQPAVDEVKAMLVANPIKAPKVPLVANTSPMFINNAEALTGELVGQIAARIRWREAVGFMADNGVTTAIELGVGSVLCGLVKRCDPRISCISLTSPEEVDTWLESQA